MPYFENNFARLHYYEYGTGEEILIAFHGFGMRGSQFNKFEKSLGNRFKIYSFDLFFHGETRLKDDSVDTIRRGLNTHEIADTLHSFLASIDKKDSSLLYYSIGAKFALAILQEFPTKINKAFFIAADGFENNLILKICSSKHINNWLLKLVYNPKILNYVLKTLYKTNYIDHTLHRILSFEFSTESYRMISYKTITYYSRLKFDRQHLANLINQNKIETHFFFGKKDKLFPAGIATRFGKLLNQPNVHIFEEGHELINDNLSTYLKNLV
jgi:pimeloyl-ACP methyl ester carboxylesterase